MMLFTIGFTKTTAQSFFERLRDAQVREVVDIRLHNVSQLAGFAKKDDLRYFLTTIGSIGYRHVPELAPTETMLATHRSGTGWTTFEKKFRALMAERRVAETLDRAMFDRACLLCSEAEPTRCHRRLVAEHLADRWKDVEIRHL